MASTETSTMALKRRVLIAENFRLLPTEHKIHVTTARLLSRNVCASFLVENDS